MPAVMVVVCVWNAASSLGGRSACSALVERSPIALSTFLLVALLVIPGTRVPVGVCVKEFSLVGFRGLPMLGYIELPVVRLKFRIP